MSIELTSKQARVLAALLGKSTLKEAAKAAKISWASLWRLLQDPDFQQAYREAKRQVVEQAISLLQQISTEAVQTLQKVMSDSGAPPTAKVSAARAVLDLAVKGVELEDLVARIEALEKYLREKGNGLKG